MNRMRRPSPAMILAVAALVVACAGGAVAASSVLVTTSRQIKPGVILGSDLHRNTVNGTRITDGSLGAVDLAAATRRALTGPAGPRGRRGLAGPRGVRGPRGRTGTVLAALRYPKASQTIAPGSTGTASAACPSDLRVIGGGGNGAKGIVLGTSAPGAAHRGWTVTATNTDPSTARKVTVTAICAAAAR